MMKQKSLLHSPLKKMRIIALSFLSFFSFSAWADAFYCTENNQYISSGMTTDAVEQACGKPAGIRKTQQEITRRVPVMQLTFNISTSTYSQLQGTYTPGLYSSRLDINTGPLTTLIVDSSNNQITDISLNGNAAQSVSICNGGTFGVGDPPSSAISSCGSPISENDTYKNIGTGKQQPVEIWTYQPSNYQPPFQLIFVNGSLVQVDTNGQ
jgi:hypothetical protein